MQKEKFTGLIFLLLAITGVVFYYHFPQMLHMLPQGSHLWRQADCMAMVWNYKLYHFPFFQPATFNLQSINGHVAGEFPVFYFMAAQCSNPELALRLVHSIVFLSGMISIYFLAFYFLKNAFLSVITSLLLFTSPLLVFYGNNFLSDVPAWSFAMMGWSLFFTQKETPKWRSLAFLFFACSALLKASYGFNFAIAFIYQLSPINKQLSFKKLIPYAIFLIPASWYSYAKWYNSQNHDSYYFLGILPAWEMSLHDIGLSFWRMIVSWSENYFWRPTSVLLIIILIYAFIKNQINIELKRMILISGIFTLIYVLLFLERMQMHEYYYVLFFVIAVFIVIACIHFIEPFIQKKWAKAFLIIFLLINIFYCKNFLARKLSFQNYNGILASDDFQKFLDEKGCTKNKTVISWFDKSVNQSLYWMKRKGYTGYNDYPTVFKNKMADYLVLSETDFLGYKTLNISPSDSIGNFHGIVLYKLK